MSKQPQQIINIYGPPEQLDTTPSCLVVAVAIAIGIIAAGVALALIAGAIW